MQAVNIRLDEVILAATPETDRSAQLDKPAVSQI